MLQFAFYFIEPFALDQEIGQEERFGVSKALVAGKPMD
jgi:hypothetical protein